MSQMPTEANALKATQQESIEIPHSGGVRKSKLVTSGDTICFPYEDLKTTWDAVVRGQKLSGNGECFGWRNTNSSYSWITYGEFIEKAENFGSGLAKIGLTLSPSSYIAIYAQTGMEWVIAQFGVWSKSSTVIPLYDTLGPDACTFIIKQAEINLVVCDDGSKVRNLIKRKKETPTLKHIVTTTALGQDLHNLANENDIILYTFKEIQDLGKNYPTEGLPPHPSDVCMICYTSGTTGDPKGVVLTHENVISECCSINLLLGKVAITKDDTVISHLPLAHIFGQFVHILFLMAGARIGFFSGDINKILDDIKVLQPTVLPAVPRTLNKWYDKAQILIRKTFSEGVEGNSQLEAETSACKPFTDNLGGKLRLIITGAAPIYSNVVEFYTKYVGCKVSVLYGQTESSGPCCGIVVDSSYDGCAGVPFACCLIKLADVPDMGYFAKELKGEVCVKGHCVFQGYLKDPVRTDEALDKDGWLHTGDIGTWLPNGMLQIIDRKKNILKLAQGLYVAPEKIENIYGLSPFVSQVFVEGHSLKSVLVAIVVPDKETLLPFCKERFGCDKWSEICNHFLAKRLIFKDMLRRGKEAGLHSFEQVKDIHVHPEVLTYEAGFFTPTLKLKREFCRKYFSNEIEDLFNKALEGI